MDFEYDRLVEAPAEAVWAALTEPATVESHLPGTTHVTSTGPEKLRLSMRISMGFLRPTVNVDVRLSDVNPEDSFRFEFVGKAMGAGVEGAATVSLNAGGNPHRSPVRGQGSGPTRSARVRMTGSVRTSGLLKRVSDSKVEAAVTGFLDEYFASVEQANSSM